MIALKYWFKPVVAFICLLLLLWSLGNYFSTSVSTYYLDSAFLIETVENLSIEGEPKSRILMSAVEGSRYWNAAPEDVCEADLATDKSSYDVLDNHAYYFLYVLSAFTDFLNPKFVIAYVHGLSFALLLIIPYWFLRRESVPPLVSVYFSVLVSMHFAWSLSAQGNFYMDRFYMPLALAYLCVLYVAVEGLKGKRQSIALGLAVILGGAAALMTERAAIMVGCSTLAILFLCWRRIAQWKIKAILGGLAFVFVLYAVWYIKYRFVGVDTGGTLADVPSKLSGMFNRWNSEAYTTKIIAFLAVNILMLGFLSIFSGYRAVMIGLAAMLPNLIVTVGGAELTGWTTHYHSMYFPVLIFVSMLGYSALVKIDRSGWFKLVKALLLTMPVLFFMTFNPYDGEFHQISSSNYKGSMQHKLLEFYFSPSRSAVRAVEKSMSRLRDLVPVDAAISVTEDAMPSLYKNSDISYYPVNYASADVLVLNHGQSDNGNRVFTGVISYQGKQAAEEVDQCMNRRLIDAGFDLKNPVFIANKAILLKEKNNVAPKAPGTEVLKNNAFMDGTNEWDVSGSVALNNGKGVLVNNEDFLYQSVNIQPKQIYRYRILANCESEGRVIRVQVNWLDGKGKLDVVDVWTESCTKNSGEYGADIYPPSGSKKAVVYLMSHDARYVNISAASIRQIKR